MNKNKDITIVCWGTYDLGKPRVRILLDNLNKSPFKVIECHINIWNNVEDKSQLKGLFPKIKILLKFIIAYPQLLFKYITLPSHNFVLIPYLGIFDIFILMPILLIKRVPVVFDFFVPLYDSIVNDRKLLSKINPLSYLIYLAEKIALHFSKVILVDTQTHGSYISQLYKVSENKCKRVFVGAEEIFFKHSAEKKSNFNTNDFNIFFYGQFIPLQGIDIIVKAAKILDERDFKDIKFTIAGVGQTSKMIDKIINDEKLDNINRIKWIPYNELPNWIGSSDLCLGIFGESKKSNSVIPNKVFQVLSTKKPIITMDTPAIQELINYYSTPNLITIPNNNPNTLAMKIEELYNNRRQLNEIYNNHNTTLNDIPQKQLIDIIMSLS